MGKITIKQVDDAMERVSILAAQIGCARIRDLHKKPLIKFLKLVEQEIKNKSQ